MPITIIHNDITKMQVDAIVNTANPNPIVGTGTDRGVYLAAGYDQLMAARAEIGSISPGHAAITDGYALPCKHIIHAVTVPWDGGTKGELDILRKAYICSLSLAKEHGCQIQTFESYTRDDEACNTSMANLLKGIMLKPCA